MSTEAQGQKEASTSLLIANNNNNKQRRTHQVVKVLCKYGETFDCCQLPPFISSFSFTSIHTHHTDNNNNNNVYEVNWQYSYFTSYFLTSSIWVSLNFADIILWSFGMANSNVHNLTPQLVVVVVPNANKGKEVRFRILVSHSVHPWVVLGTVSSSPYNSNKNRPTRTRSLSHKS